MKKKKTDVKMVKVHDFFILDVHILRVTQTQQNCAQSHDCANVALFNYYTVKNSNLINQ